VGMRWGSRMTYCYEKERGGGDDGSY